METEIMSPADGFSIRCPRLGHNLGFSYCYKENTGLPCFKILDCWFEHFDVRSYLQDRLTPEQLIRVFHRPPPTKVLSLLELIDRARTEKNEPLAAEAENTALVRAD